MCVIYIYIYIYMCMYIYIYTHTHIYIYTYMHCSFPPQPCFCVLAEGCPAGTQASLLEAETALSKATKAAGGETMLFFIATAKGEGPVDQVCAREMYLFIQMCVCVLKVLCAHK